MRIKLIYGSDTGNTELVTEDLVKLLDNIEVTTVADLTPEDWEYDNFILGINIWSSSTSYRKLIDISIKKIQTTFIITN